MEKTFVWEAILMPWLHVLLYFWPKKGPVFVPLILEDVCGKTMTDPHSVMQQEGRDFKFYNMLQHTFNKVNRVKVFTPHSQFVCFPNSSEVRVLLHNPGALELRAWIEATEITPFLDQIISLSQVGINVKPTCKQHVLWLSWLLVTAESCLMPWKGWSHSSSPRMMRCDGAMNKRHVYLQARYQRDFTLTARC